MLKLSLLNMAIDSENLKEIIRHEFPGLLKNDPGFREYVLEVAKNRFADKSQTEDWFTRTLDELRRDREEQSRKWEEQNEKWKENTVRLDRDFEKMHQQVMAVSSRVDRSLGALGARWGINTERAFRNALAWILQKNFEVEVVNVVEYDEKGVVFGHPEQIELDVVVKNGVLLICEIKSSLDKAAMYAFERKARFYEALHNRKADRLLVISPIIEAKAEDVAKALGIETFNEPEDVQSL